MNTGVGCHFRLQVLLNRSVLCGYIEVCLSVHPEKDYCHLFDLFFFKWNVFWLLFSLSKLSFGKGNENPLQYSCLGNPMDRRAWQVTVRRVAKESDVTEGLNNKPASCLQLYEDSEFRKWVSNVRYSSPNFSLVYKNACLVSQSCPTLQDALDCSLRGSPVCRIFQVRVLAWAVISLLQGVFPT